MKRVFYLMLIMTSMQYCSENNSAPNTITPEIGKNNIRDLDSDSNDRNKTEVTESVNVEPKLFNFISRDKKTNEIEAPFAIELIDNYKYYEGHESRERSRNSRTGKSQCVWFSIKELEVICKKVNATPGGDGVRIYFGKYPNRKEFDTIPTFRQGKQDHMKKRTLVFVTTIYVDSVTSRDDIRREDLQKLALMKNKYNTKEKFAAYNHGELCPKNCKGTLNNPIPAFW